MSKKRISASINLAGLVHVKMTKKGQSGNMVKGLFIPIENNYLVEGEKGGVYLNLSGQISDEKDQYDNNGFIAHSVPSNIYKNATDEQKEEFKKLAILGNIRIWDGQNEVNNSVSEETFTEEDDLPF